MLRTHAPDFRDSADDDLLAGLREREALALAEAYHRSASAAHACARRLLASSREVEALLAAVYGELWDVPPPTGPLEGWVRARVFARGAAYLQERGVGPAAPSAAALLPDLPAPSTRHLDSIERALGELEAGARAVLLAAHDQGRSAAASGDPQAPAVLRRALLALAGAADAGACADVPELPDWVLGLVGGDGGEQVAARAIGADCAELVQALRRGRRRLEGLPPTPDLGLRVLAAVLARPDRGADAAPDPASLDDEPVGADEPGLSATSEDRGGERPEEDTADLTEVTAALRRPSGGEPDPSEPAPPASARPAGPGEADPAAEPTPSADGDEAEAGAARPRTAGSGAVRRAARWVAILLVLLLGGAVGLYVGQLIVSRWL